MIKYKLKNENTKKQRKKTNKKTTKKKQTKKQKKTRDKGNKSDVTYFFGFQFLTSGDV